MIDAKAELQDTVRTSERQLDSDAASLASFKKENEACSVEIGQLAIAMDAERNKTALLKGELLETFKISARSTDMHETTIGLLKEDLRDTIVESERKRQVDADTIAMLTAELSRARHDLHDAEGIIHWQGVEMATVIRKSLKPRKGANSVEV